MKVKLVNGCSASQDDINRAENEIELPLDPYFLEFVKDYDGAEPENNMFNVGEGNGSGVNRFIPVKEIHREMKLVEGIPEQSYPIAWAEGGNYVFISQATGGGVFFWDHELPGTVFKIADNFHMFLESLEPFDVDSIEVRPGSRVIRANPDFLAKFKMNRDGK